MEQRPRDVGRLLTLALAGLFVGVAAAAVVIGARSEDGPSESLDAVAERAPEETIVLRLMAPDGGCWTRTIAYGLEVEDDVTQGCGPVAFPVRVQQEVNISFERSPPASWTWCLVATVDGKVVLTRGPDSNPAYSLDVYVSPSPTGFPTVEVEPVTCAEN